MYRFGPLLVLGLALTPMSCANLENSQTNMFPEVDENGNPIDWAKEIEAYNADPNTKNKIVCKEVTPTGSHIPRMMCQTEAQRDNRRRQDQRAIEDFLQPGY